MLPHAAVTDRCAAAAAAVRAWALQQGVVPNHPYEHYLMGPWYSTAEVLLTPWVARMVEVLPEWRGVDVLEECKARRLEHVAGWMRACLARPSAKATSPRNAELLHELAEAEMSHTT
jgi:glutathione S-transferase